MSELLKITDLKVDFTTPRGELHAVRGVTLSVAPGESVGIVGESGSGKTVMSRATMGLLRGRRVKRAGSVVFDGDELLGLSAKEIRDYWGTRIAMVFQDPMTALNPVRRIRSQMSEALVKRLGKSKEEADARALELMKLVRIPDPEAVLDKYPHQLSGGMRQRVMIAMAIACEPRLLFADEPTTALDATVQAQILELISDLRRQLGMSMVIITHDLGIVALHTDRVAVMYAGEVVEMATTKEIFAKPRMPYTEALMTSIPRLDREPGSRLASIGGTPPDPTAERMGCGFAPRCKYATDKCRSEHPELVDDGSGHLYRCFFPLGGN